MGGGYQPKKENGPRGTPPSGGSAAIPAGVKMRPILSTDPFVLVPQAEIDRLREIARAARWIDFYLHNSRGVVGRIVPSACRAHWNAVAARYWPDAHWRQKREPYQETRAEKFQRLIFGSVVIAILLWLGLDSDFGQTVIGLFRIHVLGF